MKMKIFVLITGLLFSRLVLVAQADRTASQLFQMAQYNQAKTAFFKSLRSNDNAEDWFCLGKIYAFQMNRDSAQICFNKAGKIDPKSTLTLVGQAWLEYLENNKAQSRLSLDKAQRAAISDKEVNALVEIAETRFISGDTLKWIMTMEFANNLDKKYTRAYIVAGNIYFLMGNRYNQSNYYGLASGRYQQALYLEPDNPEALSGMAGIYIKIRNYEESMTLLTKVLAEDSTYIPALKYMGELCYILGKYADASKYFGKYILLSENNDKDLTRYITILYFNKEYAKAAENIDRQLSVNPSNPVMLRLKGYTACELNQNQEGLDAMKKFFAVRSTADTSKVIATDYEYYGKLLSRTGYDSLAIVNLTRAFEMDTSKTVLLEDIARMYEKQKKYAEAIRYFEKLVRVKRNDVQPVIFFSMGKDFLILADNVKLTNDSLLRPDYLAKAAAAFGKVIAASPNSYLGYQWRARASAGLDPETSLGLAKTDYEKAISILESKNDQGKYAADLIEGYRYLGYYYYLKYDGIEKSSDIAAREQAKASSKAYWQKVLAIDPANEVAKQALSALK